MLTLPLLQSHIFLEHSVCSYIVSVPATYLFPGLLVALEQIEEMGGVDKVVENATMTARLVRSEFSNHFELLSKHPSNAVTALITNDSGFMLQIGRAHV